MLKKQGRIHGYLDGMQVGRGNFWGHLSIWAGAVWLGFGPQDWDLGLMTGIWASSKQMDRRTDGQRRRKFPICVKA